MVETFKYTHTLKENNERFADQWSTDHYRLEETTQQTQHTGEDDNNSVDSVVNPNTVLHKTASEPYKNRVYRLGSFFTNNLRTSTLRASSASTTSRTVDPEDRVGAASADGVTDGGVAGADVHWWQRRCWWNTDITA
ncbi:uncharacterized protein DS421_5g162080 [Arachis hypogaea]|nr:uncharacterized protein DS421_5g162080 [Arachis hypogaea]